MKRAGKIILSIISALLVIVAGVLAYDLWTEWHYKNYGGYAAAGIEPIPGAELTYYRDDSNILGNYDTTWIYKVPPSYTDKLYKDCSAIRYKTGVLLGYESDGRERIDPKRRGCHLQIDPYRSEMITAEFSGDQLTVEDNFGG